MIINRTHNSYIHANRAIIGLMLGCVVLAFGMLAFNAIMPGVLPTCLSKTIFGRPCPLCGLTRAFGALARGEFAVAQKLNPIAVPLAVLLTLEVVYRAGLLVAARKHDLPIRFLRADLVVHGFLVAAYVVYSALLMCGALDGFRPFEGL